MKISPSTNRTSPFYPAIIAMAGAVLTGCDKQKVPGIVPYQEPGNTTAPSEQKEKKPDTPSEEPIKLGGKVPCTPNEE